MKSITIRGIEPDLDKAIKARASRENLSVNLWVIKTLKQATGTGKQPFFRKYEDLDSLAGGWNRKEAETFSVLHAQFFMLCAIFTLIK